MLLLIRAHQPQAALRCKEAATGPAVSCGIGWGSTGLAGPCSLRRNRSAERTAARAYDSGGEHHRVVLLHEIQRFLLERAAQTGAI